MENIILSMLLIKSMTVYEMKMFIQYSLNNVCSDSLGSIQSAIKKLLASEKVEVVEVIDNNMIKKVYSITDKGLVQFNDWISSPMNLDKFKNMEEGKFFFLGMAPKEVRIRSLQGYIESLQLAQVKFVQIQNFIESTKDSSIQENVERIKQDEGLAKHLLTTSGEDTLEKAVQNIYNYQVYNLEYALKQLREDIKFFEGLLKREMETN